MDLVKLPKRKSWNMDNYKVIYYFDKAICQESNALKRIDEYRIIVGGTPSNKKILIISINKWEIIKEINNEFLCWGICIIEEKGIFLIGGVSKEIKIYRSDNYECIKIINNAHNNFIFGLDELQDNSLVSYGSDKIIKVWSI